MARVLDQDTGACAALPSHASPPAFSEFAQKHARGARGTLGLLRETDGPVARQVVLPTYHWMGSRRCDMGGAPARITSAVRLPAASLPRRIANVTPDDASIRRDRARKRVPVERFPADPITPYASIRALVRSGDLLLCSGNYWFSKLLRKASNSCWSHVGFVMESDSSEGALVLESVERLGVRTVPLAKYLDDYDDEGHPYPGGIALARHRDFAARANPDMLRQLGRAAAERFGYAYAADQIGRIAARIAASRLANECEEWPELERRGDYVCSEYVGDCYRSVGIEIKPVRRGVLAPADFARDPAVELLAVLRAA